MKPSDNSLPAGGTTLRAAFEALVATLNEHGIRYAIIGGLALMQHTRVRATDDVDALVAAPQTALPALLEALGRRGFEIELQKNVREFFEGGLTSLRYGNTLVDLVRPLIPAFSHVLEKAITVDLFGQKVRVSSAEGLLVMKLMAWRSQDEADIRDLLTAYGGKLDLDFVRAELSSFTSPDDPRRERFETLVRQAGNQASK